MRALLVLLALAFAPGLPAAAQDRDATLADIRRDLGALGAEITGLRRELVETGAVSQPGGGDMLERMDAIEAELMRLTGKAEEIEIRLNRVVADGTNRVGDLEFRLVELEGGDVSQLGQTPPLGGEAAPGAASGPDTGGPQLAMGEQADFDRAREVLGQGDFRTAADLLAAYAETFPGGPLTGEAHFLRGEALEQMGETASAARAYLESFSGVPDGSRAPEALFRLGRSLAQLGQVPEACVTLAEVNARFPGSPAAGDAIATMGRLECR